MAAADNDGDGKIGADGMSAPVRSTEDGLRGRLGCESRLMWGKIPTH